MNFSKLLLLPGDVKDFGFFKRHFAGYVLIQLETFEKCSILFKIKQSENLNHPDRHRDRHPYLVVFRGLIFERDAACPAIAFGDGGRLSKRERFSKVSGGV